MLALKIHKLRLTETFFTSLIQARQCLMLAHLDFPSLSFCLRKARHEVTGTHTQAHTHVRARTQKLRLGALGKLVNE